MAMPRPPRSLLVAFALSVAVHLTVIFEAPISPPSEPAPVSEVLEARMEAPPPPPAAQIEPRPRRAPPVQKPRHPAAPHPPQPESPPATAAPEPQAPVADAAPTPEPAEPSPSVQDQPVAQTEPEPPAQAEPPAPEQKRAEPPLPPRGRAVYTLYKGNQGLNVGRVVHSWEYTDDGYMIRSVTEATGLFSLIKPGQIVQESRGRIVAGGFQPEQYWIQRGSSAPRDTARFDWQAMRVHFEARGSTYDAPLKDNAQDLLSFQYQFGFVRPTAGAVPFPVTNGRKLDIYTYDVAGEETVETPSAGSFRTLHLIRSGGAEKTEIWLAVDKGYLPVRVRMTSKDGSDQFEQVIERMEIPRGEPAASGK